MAGKKRERSEGTRQHILEAALSCFARHGYDKTSTSAIAKAAGVSQGIIFHYFGTKEGLFSAIVRKSLEGFDECVKKAEQSGLPPSEKIQLLMRLMGERTLAEPYRHEIELIIRQLFQMDLDAQAVEGLGIAGVVGTIQSAFEEGKRLGAFGDIDTQTAALSVLGIFLANFVWSSLSRGHDFVPALQRGCAMFLEGVARR
jgi:AcrR family transcriptional regulator